MRLAIISSHPIQYNAPLFIALSEMKNIELKVFYSWSGASNQLDAEFGEKITWDIPLLEGYPYTFVKNEASSPGTYHFFGLDNPSMIVEIESWNADVILVYGWAFKTHLKVIRHFSKLLPVVFRGDSTLLTGGYGVRRLLRKIILHWVYRYIDMALYPGKMSKAYFLAYGVPAEKLHHVVHSVDNERFSLRAASLELQAIHRRREMNIPLDSLVLLFAGKFVPRKEPIFLLNTVKNLVEEKGLKLHLIFVGAGPLEKELHLQADNCNYIHFLGFKNQTEMPLIYRLSDVYILPSTVETWGLGVNEAMASSRPVIVSDKVGCGPDLVKSTVSGDVFISNNEKSLSEILMKYSKTPKYLQGMRATSSEFINNWSTYKAAEKIADCLKCFSLDSKP